MLRQIKTEFTEDKEKGTVTATIYDQYNTKYVGTARCHPDDHYSATGGKLIAESRARLKWLKAYRHYDLMPQVDALLHLLSTCTSDTHSPRIDRELQLAQERVDLCKECEKMECEYAQYTIASLEAVSRRAKEKKTSD